jgi:hypothetical protein
MDKDEAFKWFALGFAQTREGFNSECPYAHLSPYHPRRSNPLYVGGDSDKLLETELKELFDELWQETPEEDIFRTTSGGEGR